MGNGLKDLRAQAAGQLASEGGGWGVSKIVLSLRREQFVRKKLPLLTEKSGKGGGDFVLGKIGSAFGARRPQTALQGKKH